MPEPSEYCDKLAAWRDALARLADDIERWCEQEHWLVHRESKQISEQGIATYSAPVLTVQTNQGRIRVEPDALHIAGGTGGRVDIYSWPDLNQVLLIDFENGWRVYDQNQAKVIDTWNKDAFIKLAKDLAAAA